MYQDSSSNNNRQVTRPIPAMHAIDSFTVSLHNPNGRDLPTVRAAQENGQ